MNGTGEGICVPSGPFAGPQYVWDEYNQLYRISDGKLIKQNDPYYDYCTYMMQQGFGYNPVGGCLPVHEGTIPPCIPGQPRNATTRQVRQTARQTDTIAEHEEASNLGVANSHETSNATGTFRNTNNAEPTRAAQPTGLIIDSDTVSEFGASGKIESAQISASFEESEMGRRQEELSKTGLAINNNNSVPSVQSGLIRNRESALSNSEINGMMMNGKKLIRVETALDFLSSAPRASLRSDTELGNGAIFTRSLSDLSRALQTSNKRAELDRVIPKLPMNGISTATVKSLTKRLSKISKDDARNARPELFVLSRKTPGGGKKGGKEKTGEIVGENDDGQEQGFFLFRLHSSNDEDDETTTTTSATTTTTASTNTTTAYTTYDSETSSSDSSSDSSNDDDDSDDKKGHKKKKRLKTKKYSTTQDSSEYDDEYDDYSDTYDSDYYDYTGYDYDYDSDYEDYSESTSPQLLHPKRRRGYKVRSSSSETSGWSPWPKRTTQRILKHQLKIQPIRETPLVQPLRETPLVQPIGETPLVEPAPQIDPEVSPEYNQGNQNANNYQTGPSASVSGRVASSAAEYIDGQEERETRRTPNDELVSCGEEAELRTQCQEELPCREDANWSGAPEQRATEINYERRTTDNPSYGPQDPRKLTHGPVDHHREEGTMTRNQVYEPQNDRKRRIYNPECDSQRGRRISDDPSYDPRNDRRMIHDPVFVPQADRGMTYDSVYEPQDDRRMTASSVYETQDDRNPNYYQQDDRRMTHNPVYCQLDERGVPHNINYDPQDERGMNQNSNYDHQDNRRMTHNPNYHPQDNRRMAHNPNYDPQDDRRMIYNPNYHPQDDRRMAHNLICDPRDVRRMTHNQVYYPQDERGIAQNTIYDPQADKRIIQNVVYDSQEWQWQRPGVYVGETAADPRSAQTYERYDTQRNQNANGRTDYLHEEEAIAMEREEDAMRMAEEQNAVRMAEEEDAMRMAEEEEAMRMEAESRINANESHSVDRCNGRRSTEFVEIMAKAIAFPDGKYEIVDVDVVPLKPRRGSGPSPKVKSSTSRSGRSRRTARRAPSCRRIPGTPCNPEIVTTQHPRAVPQHPIAPSQDHQIPCSAIQQTEVNSRVHDVTLQTTVSDVAADKVNDSPPESAVTDVIVNKVNDDTLQTTINDIIANKINDVNFQATINDIIVNKVTDVNLKTTISDVIVNKVNDVLQRSAINDVIVSKVSEVPQRTTSATQTDVMTDVHNRSLPGLWMESHMTEPKNIMETVRSPESASTRQMEAVTRGYSSSQTGTQTNDCHHHHHQHHQVTSAASVPSRSPLYRRHHLNFSSNCTHTSPIPPASARRTPSAHSVAQHFPQRQTCDRILQTDSLDRDTSSTHLVKYGNFIYSLYQQDQLTDVILKAGVECFYAHRSVLACHSHYFASVFTKDPISSSPSSSQLSPRQTPDILEVNDVSPSILRKLLDYIYTGRMCRLSVEISLHQSFLLDVLIAASKLGLPQLESNCIQKLNGLHPQELLDVMISAYRQGITTSDLVDKLWHRIACHFKTVIRSKQFLQMNVDCVCRLLLDNDLVLTSEIDVAQAAIRWINEDREKRVPVAGRVLSCIRFKNLTPDELVSFVSLENYILKDPAVKDAILEANWYHTCKLGRTDTDMTSFKTPHIRQKTDLRSHGCRAELPTHPFTIPYEIGEIKKLSAARSPLE